MGDHALSEDRCGGTKERAFTPLKYAAEMLLVSGQTVGGDSCIDGQTKLDWDVERQSYRALVEAATVAP
jgi:hypothetical protein